MECSPPCHGGDHGFESRTVRVSFTPMKEGCTVTYYKIGNRAYNDTDSGDEYIMEWEVVEAEYFSVTESGVAQFEDENMHTILATTLWDRVEEISAGQAKKVKKAEAIALAARRAARKVLMEERRARHAALEAEINTPLFPEDKPEVKPSEG